MNREVAGCRGEVRRATQGQDPCGRRRLARRAARSFACVSVCESRIYKYKVSTMTVRAIKRRKGERR